MRYLAGLPDGQSEYINTQNRPGVGSGPGFFSQNIFTFTPRKRLKPYCFDTYTKRIISLVFLKKPEGIVCTALSKQKIFSRMSFIVFIFGQYGRSGKC